MREYKNSSNMTIPNQSTGAILCKYYFPNVTISRLAQCSWDQSAKNDSQVNKNLEVGLNLAHYHHLSAPDHGVRCNDDRVC